MDQAQVKLKGCDKPRRLCRATARRVE